MDSNYVVYIRVVVSEKSGTIRGNTGLGIGSAENPHMKHVSFFSRPAMFVVGKSEIDVSRSRGYSPTTSMSASKSRLPSQMIFVEFDL